MEDIESEIEKMINAELFTKDCKIEIPEEEIKYYSPN
jgi:hypothetical protein